MNFFCKPCRQRTSKIRLNVAELCPEPFSLTSSGENFQNASELKSKQLHFWTQKSRKCAISFLWSLHGENFWNPSELHGKLLRFWTQKSWICAQNLFCKTCSQITSKMRLNLTANSFVFGHISPENASITFLWTLQAEDFKNASELHGKQLRFWTQKSRQCAKSFLHKPHKAKTSKMRLNSTTNCFIFGHKNRDNAPWTFL